MLSRLPHSNWKCHDASRSCVGGCAGQTFGAKQEPVGRTAFGRIPRHVNPFSAHPSPATIEQSAAVAQTLVVTRDPDVAELARTFGARVFSEEDPLDLNVAVTSAVELAQQRGAMTTMILPSDLPLLRHRTFTICLPSTQTSYCPDRHNSGTNALVLRSANGFVFQYGKDSFHLHLAEAARQGVSAEICRSPGVRFDLDTEEDWQQYQQQIKHENKQPTLTIVSSVGATILLAYT